MDPYGVLAILGFLVFLFYLIYNYLNATGNAGRRLLPHYLKINLLNDITMTIWRRINDFDP